VVDITRGYKEVVVNGEKKVVSTGTSFGNTIANSLALTKRKIGDPYSFLQSLGLLNLPEEFLIHADYVPKEWVATLPNYIEWDDIRMQMMNSIGTGIDKADDLTPAEAEELAKRFIKITEDAERKANAALAGATIAWMRGSTLVELAEKRDKKLKEANHRERGSKPFDYEKRDALQYPYPMFRVYTVIAESAEAIQRHNPQLSYGTLDKLHVDLLFLEVVYGPCLVVVNVQTG